MRPVSIRMVGAALLCCGRTVVHAQPVAYQPVWVTGDAVPGLGTGVVFSGYTDAPVINATGKVAFSSTFEGAGVSGQDNRGIFTGMPGTLTLLHRTGVQIPGAPAGVVSTSLAQVRLGDSGSALFTSSLAGPGISGNNNSANIGGAGPGVGIVAQTGTPAPGSPAPYAILYGGLVNASGQFGIVADLTSDHSQRGMWIVNPGQAPQLVARTGSVAPGMPAGWTFREIWNPSLSDTAQVAFFASVTDTVVTRPGLYVGSPSGTVQIASTSTVAPGTGGSTFSEFATSPSSSRAGDIAFAASYVIQGTPKSGIFKTSGGATTALQPVVLGDVSLPQTPAGAQVDLLRRVTISDTGAVGFNAQLAHTGGISAGNDEGIWIKKGGLLTTIAREGTQAPGLPGGIVHLFTSGIAQSALNALDQLVFLNDLGGPGVTTANDRALFFWDPLGGLTTIVREGDLFQVGPSDSRVISLISFAGSQQASSEFMGPGGTGGTPSGLSDRGVLTFGLRFTDGTSGIFTAQVPSPSGLSVPTLVAFRASRRRRASNR